MKQFLFTVLVLISAQNIFALPLVFKATKEVKTSGADSVELITLDTSKYSKLRVGVALISGQTEQEENLIQIFGLEDESLINLENFVIPHSFRSTSVFIDAPPTKLKISAKGQGIYKIFVWASS